MINSSSVTADYEVKPSSYFEEVRAEMECFVPPSVHRILDVGCGSGGFGAFLKKSRDVEVWGVEPFESAAAHASKRLDKVIHGFFAPDLDLPTNSFDCIVFNDVLEHLLDPAAAIRYAHKLLRPGGVVVASIPNIRHFPTLWHLVMHGQWEYRDCGTLDRTHLRFFTRASLLQLIESERFTIRHIEGINMYCGVPNASRRVWRAFKLLNFLAMRKFEDLKFQQFAVVAEANK